MTRDDFYHLEPTPVRWADMDAFAHVNNAVYFTYCESARMALFNRLGLDKLREHERHGPALVHAACDFHRQVHHPAELETGVRVSEVGRRSFTLEYAIFVAGEPVVVAEGKSVVVWVDYDAGRAAPMPAALRETLVRAFEATAEQEGRSPSAG